MHFMTWYYVRAILDGRKNYCTDVPDHGTLRQDVKTVLMEQYNYSESYFVCS